MSVEIVTLRDDRAGSSARILVSYGFNCFSFVARANDEPLELLWSAPGFESGTLRPSHSGIPILFPFAGRLPGRQLSYDGRTYAIGEYEDAHHNAIHGYVLGRPWKVIEQGANRVVGRLHAAEQAPELLDKWPADFQLTVEYELQGNTLVSRFSVANPDVRPLPFGLGTHGYFRVPLGSGGSADECRVTLPAQKLWKLDQMLPTGECEPVAGGFDLRQGMRFADTQLDTAFDDLALDGDHYRGSIADPHSGRTLEVSFDPFFRACVLYNPPHREAICIEPYSSIPDAFRLAARGLDPNLKILAPGASVSAEITMRLR
jgi:aldose 1-epimerase